MKIYREWLQTHFDDPLPAAEKLADALTFHAFEIESVENDVLDVKVTPNRGHDCLCHRGIAKELSAILTLEMKNDALRDTVALEPADDSVAVRIEVPDLCKRYVAARIRGVAVHESPAWLKKRLEAIGQRPINNIVDATNYVMFELGQPLHAFDAGKLSQKDGGWAIAVRRAAAGERVVGLDGAEYTLGDSMLAIADAHNDAPIGIAGIKGGAASSITEDTSEIILEAANFDGPTVRRGAAAIKLRTDASSRFEQVISPELAGFGMQAVVRLILELAGGEVQGYVDEYPARAAAHEVAVSLEKANRVLGVHLSREAIADVLSRLGFTWREDAWEVFTVAIPFERLDLDIAEDLIEEIGRIIGYDKVPAAELPAFPKEPGINANFVAAEAMREELQHDGYSEVFTSVFTDAGDRAVANKIGGDRPFLRRSIVPSLTEALERNVRMKDLLGISKVRLFEIGTIWAGGKEKRMIATAEEKGTVKERELEPMERAAYEKLALSQAHRYEPFSKYPFAVRDIALWVPADTSGETVLTAIRESAGSLLAKSWKFDEYHKGERTSFAFRLVFQSFDKTLTDGDIDERMASVNREMQQRGWEVR